MIQNVACIGAGFVGGPLGVVIAYKCPDVRVVVVDRNASRIRAWVDGSPSFYEPGLNETLATVQAREDPRRNLEFVTTVETAIQQADVIFLCVDTPTKSFGAGRGCAADLTNIQGVARTIAQVARGKKIIVEKSTVPCGTGDILHDLLSICGSPQAHCEILSNPEFLAEGSAMENLLRPSRVLIGSAQTETGKRAAVLLATLYEMWIPRSSILRMDRWSSELAKLAANAILAQRISSINSLSAICEAAGAATANVDSVSTACGLDPRIGPHMLRGSIGWGGECFRKDVLDLSDAIVIATGWDQFRTPCSNSDAQETLLDWPRVVHAMQHPKYVFDGRNLLDGAFLTRLGCRYVRVGSSSAWDGAGWANLGG